MAESQISNKIWNIAGVLRDGGVSYGDYLEQITFLLFLKMVDENKKMAAIDPELQMFSMEGMDMPNDFDWFQLSSLQGEGLIQYYEKLLSDLSKRKGMIGEIYRGARNKVEKASLLKKVVDMIDAVDWSSQSEDVKGDIYESLLQRIAQDTKSGAGQYFTPRALINVIVKCVNPKVTEETKIADPCCGSGGFLLAARKHIGNVHSERLNKAIQESVFQGTEYVESTYRMCLMNLLLHGIGTFNGVPPIKCQDSLAHAPGDGDLCDYVLTNPPFGKKSFQTIEVEKLNKEGETITVLEKEKDSYTRQDFIAATNNKQLNFIQHIKSMLKVGGQAAVVVPDNVLFETNAGETIRKSLLKTCDLHTILRLPSGLFYAQGIKANVLFFEKRPASDSIHTKEVWIYDYRTNIHHTLKQNPLQESDLEDFIKCYNPQNRRHRVETYDAVNNKDGRWRRFSYDEIIGQSNTSLDITWIKEEDNEDFDLSLNEKFDLISQFISIVDKYNLNKEILHLTASKAFDEILNLAIKGELVPHCTNSEPASELLLKIKQEKEKLVQENILKKKDLESTPIKEEEMPFSLPDNWVWTRFEDIAIDSADGPFGSNLKREHYTEERQVRIIQLSNIGDNGWKDANTRYTTFEHLKNISRSEAFPGDIIVAKMMPAGRAIICPDYDPKYVLSSDAVKFNFSKHINREYLYWAINSKVVKDQVYSEVQGITRVRTSLNKLRTYLIPIPPYEEQELIVTHLQEILPILERLK